jgi:hypothetical protein
VHSQQKPNTGSAGPGVDEGQEAISGQHHDLRKLVAVVSRVARVDRITAWWLAVGLADPMCGPLSLEEWRSLASISRRSADHIEAACAPPGWRSA